MDAQITRTNVSKIHRPLLAAASPTPDATTEPVPKLTCPFSPALATTTNLGRNRRQPEG